MRIVFASSNRNKTEELQHYLAQSHIELVPQTEFHISDADETATTFVENALLKAHHAATLSGLPAIADDSGLVVPALQGEPGVFSARYAGVNATSEENIQRLLQEMHDLPDEKRTGFFHCVLVYLAFPLDPTPVICHGILQGTILRHERKGRHFGYDPIFYVPEYQAAMSELSLDIKNRISHRGIALQKLLLSLQEQLCTP